MSSGDKEGLLLISIFFVCVAMILVPAYFVGKNEKEKRAWFMQECLKDHKEYQCFAMWKSGESNTVAVPMPMPVIVR